MVVAVNARARAGGLEQLGLLPVGEVARGAVQEAQCGPRQLGWQIRSLGDELTRPLRGAFGLAQQSVDVRADERLRHERRIGGMAGQREVQLRRAAAERPGGVDEHSGDLAHDRGRRCCRELQHVRGARDIIGRLRVLPPLQRTVRVLRARDSSHRPGSGRARERRPGARTAHRSGGIRTRRPRAAPAGSPCWS